MHEGRRRIGLVLMGLWLMLTGGVAEAQQAGYQWGTVAIGGGGYYTGVIFHRSVPGLAYLRSDVIGPFRRDGSDEPWKMQTFNQWLPTPYTGCSAIGLHPTDPMIVYAEMGSYGEGVCGLFRSLDGGVTWTQMLQRYSHGNAGDGAEGTSRKAGEAIAVDVNNGEVVYWGSRSSGIWQTTDGGQMWVNVRPREGDEAGPGTRSVAVDPTVVENGRSKYVYASVDLKGVWQSSDGGTTWSMMSGLSALPGGPMRPQWMTVGTDGVLYVTHEQGIARYSRSGGWVNITPSGQSGLWMGVSVDAQNPARLVAMRNSRVWRSTDRGNTWLTKVFDSGTFTVRTRIPWSTSLSPANGAPAGVFLDPHHPGRCYVTDAFMVWRTEDVWAANSVWEAQYRGAENCIAITLHAPPASTSGNAAVLYAGVSDVRGFRLEDIFTHPRAMLHNPGSGLNYITGIGASYQNPDVMMITMHQVSLGAGRTYRSTDGGKTFTQVTSPTSNNYGGAKIAVSATDPLRAVWAGGNNQSLRFTTNGGQSWSNALKMDNTTLGGVSGDTTAYNYDQLLAADTVNGQVFYLMRVFNGTGFWYSLNGGRNWQPSNTSISRSGSDHGGTVSVVPAPGREGEVWLSNGSGIYRSTDYGANFTRISAFVNEQLSTVSLGASAPGSDAPTVYVYGRRTGSSERGLHRSLDMGQSWEYISGHVQLPLRLRFMAADQRTFGRVYFHNQGGGVGYGLINDGAPTFAGVDDLVTAVNTVVSDEFTVSDEQTPDAMIRVTVTGNSNPLLVTHEGLLIEHLGGNRRRLVVTPAADQVGKSVITLNANDATDGNVVGSRSSSVQVNLTVGDAQWRGAYLFYNQSAFDGHDPAINAADDAAIAPDKQPLLPGHKATFVNYSSYHRGMNGLMIDIAGLPVGGTVGLQQFLFMTGRSTQRNDWQSAPAPTGLLVRRGAGVQGSDRISFTWPSGTIRNTWLRVQVQADAQTGLAEPVAFYLGNAVGETGNSSAHAYVDASDELAVRNNPRGFLNPASITNVHDMDRDQRVDANDELIVRQNQAGFLQALPLLILP